MRYDNSLYSSPEKYGLMLVGDIDFSDGFYQFDLTAIWRDGDGNLYYADDSGCSCPSPFELTERDSLTAATFSEVAVHLAERLSNNEEAYGDTRGGETERIRGAVVELLARLREV